MADGNEHTIQTSNDNIEITIRVHQEEQTGDMNIQTHFKQRDINKECFVVDRRHSISRTEMKQTLYQLDSADSVINDSTIRIAERIYIKQESPEEAAAEELAEKKMKERIRQLAATIASASTTTPQPDSSSQDDLSIPSSTAVSPVSSLPSLSPSPSTSATILPSSPVIAELPSSNSSSSIIPSTPVLPSCSLSGRWRIDKPRSDKLDVLLAACGVPWIARKVVDKLEVLCEITYNTQQDEKGNTINQCIITETSSAGKKVSVFDIDGEWHTHTAEGKKSELRCSDNIRPEHLTLRSHPLNGGYLFVESVLPDSLGDMENVRVLTSRTQMTEITTIKKNGKTTVVCTRYHVKQETPAETQQAEQEWNDKIKLYDEIQNRREEEEQQHTHQTPAEQPVEIKDNEHGEQSGSIVAPILPAPISIPTSTASITPPFVSTPVPAAIPNFSGMWRVCKDKSNDLTQLLKRMNVGWFYRKVATTVDAVTIIEQNAQQFVVTDKSKLGSFTSSYRTDGAWHHVKQYAGKDGIVSVHIDNEKKEVTIETTFLDENQIQKLVPAPAFARTPATPTKPTRYGPQSSFTAPISPLPAALISPSRVRSPSFAYSVSSLPPFPLTLSSSPPRLIDIRVCVCVAFLTAFAFFLCSVNCSCYYNSQYACYYCCSMSLISPTNCSNYNTNST